MSLRAIFFFNPAKKYGNERFEQPISSFSLRLRKAYVWFESYLTIGAFHYAKDSGNFGRNSNGRVRFGFFRPEYSGSPLDFGSNISIEVRRSIFDKPVLCPNYGIRKL